MDALLELLDKFLLPRVRDGWGQVMRPGAGHGPAEDQRNFLAAYLPQLHTHYEAVWLLHGVAHLKVRDSVQELREGDFCFLPPQWEHADLFNRDTPPYTSLWFCYSPSRLNCMQYRYLPFGRGESQSLGCIAMNEALLAAFAELESEGATADGYTRDAVRARLLGLVVQLLRATHSHAAISSSAAANGHIATQVQKYLLAHFGEPLTLAQVGKAIHLSPNYLSAIYKQETGQTVLDTLTTIRMDEAARLLLTENLPVKTVAQRVGYSSAEHFSRTFRKEKGLPPSRYGVFHAA